MSFVFDLVAELDRLRHRYGITTKVKYSNAHNPCFKGVCFISSKVKQALEKNKEASRQEINQDLFLAIEEIIKKTLTKTPQSFPEGFFLAPIVKILEKWQSKILHGINNPRSLGVSSRAFSSNF